ncbi:hypothetical protein K1T71_011038 [Dendrolimus kikuchii]|uniref:Uncharacterized protein n=1 Tax=Dendrolimus kikuchii TaxID=765133 RepID=A0ACC1CMP7_9NEOP|nr:hypothetical protein K1T71_011038 [Dendrolimus kikuchii]
MAQYEVVGKNFLITGGASGLGAAYVEIFIGLGAKNVAVLDIAVEAGKALVDRLNTRNAGKAIFIKCDVSKEEEIAKAFNEVLATFKQIDVVINNAGIMVDAPDVWRKSCDVNWQGLISFTMKAINHMSKAEGGAGGTIINISSVAALMKLPLLPIYSGSKMAVLHFSQSIAMDPFFQQTGVRILTMCFHATDTPLLHGLEKRSYDPKHGKTLADFSASQPVANQKVSSAVDAVVLMYKTGPPGSIWYSADNKPGRNITSIIDEAFADFQKKILDACTSKEHSYVLTLRSSSTMAQYEVVGKNFLITGGASGLGAAYVEIFIGLGAKNVAVLDIAVEAGKALVDRVNTRNAGKAIFIKCDISKEEEIAKAFNEVLAAFKQIDVVINNAGIMVDAPDVWRKACDVNWQGLVSFTMKAINHMSKAEGGAGGTIINISSLAALMKVSFLPIYSGSKMAVLHFSQSIAMDPFFQQTGVRILTMCFKATDTPLLHGLEKRSYDPKHGKPLADFVASQSEANQKVSSAVDAVVLMYRTGPPGSIWYSADNKPGRNVTSIIDAAFADFQKKILEA